MKEAVEKVINEIRPILQSDGGDIQLIGVDEKTAAEDACRVEHYISDKTFDAIKAHMKMNRS